MGLPPLSAAPVATKMEFTANCTRAIRQSNDTNFPSRGHSGPSVILPKTDLNAHTVAIVDSTPTAQLNRIVEYLREKLKLAASASAPASSIAASPPYKSIARNTKASELDK